MSLTKPFKLLDWIDDNREHLKPPVCNKQMFDDGGDFIVQVVGGPNSRTDYHLDEGPELFYQVEGEMLLKTVQDGRFVVVERKRSPSELDGFMWFCPKCANKLHEEYLHVADIVKDLPPVFERFYSNAAARTCKRCGTVMPPR